MRSFLRRRSTMFLVIVSFVAFFVTSEFVQHWLYSGEHYSGYNKRRMSNLMAQMKVAYALIEDGRIELLKERFDFHQKHHEVDFVQLIGNGSTVHAFGDVPADLNIASNEIFVGDSYGCVKIEVQGYTFLAGIKFDYVDYHMRAAQKYNIYVFRNIFLVTIAIIFIVGFFLKDIRKLLKLVKSGQIEELSNLSTFSEEGKALGSTLSEIGHKISEVKHQNQLLKEQLLPALKSELFSGIEPPYDFNCALVRSDINNFTKILSDYDKDTFMGQINEFFQDCTHIISRYDGVVSEFLGDEVIFYFKDSNAEDAVQLALCALRDINQVAERMNQRTLKEQGYSFRIKSAVSYGELRFSKQVDRFTVSGAPLIESVRILSGIHHRDDNVVWVSDMARSMSGPLFEFTSCGEIELKGLGQREVFELSHKKSWEESERSKHPLQELYYYRSDEDYLKTAHRFLKNQDFDGEFKEACRLMRIHPPFGVEASFVGQWFEILMAAKGHSDSRVLSSLVGVSEGILQGCPLEADQLAIFHGFLDHSDSRVVANTVDLLTAIGETNLVTEIRGLVRHVHYRVQAAAILHCLSVEWDSELVFSIRKMLTSRRLLRRASGLWALSRVHEKYMAENSFILKSNSDYQEIYNLGHQIVAQDAGDLSDYIKAPFLKAAKAA